MTTKSSARFPDKEAARFYGISRAQIMILRKPGTAHGDRLPIDDPAEMVAWYERMHAKGLRRRACPDSVLARPCEATAPAAKPAKSKRGKASTAPADGS